MEYPKVDLPGKWRWMDKWFSGDSRIMKLQRKVGPFWVTEAKEIYWPGKSWSNDAQAVSGLLLRRAQRKHELYKKEVTPA